MSKSINSSGIQVKSAAQAFPSLWFIRACR